MRTEKVCLSIGVGRVILAIGFLALRSDKEKRKTSR